MERESRLKNYLIGLIDIISVALAFAVVIFVGNNTNEFIGRIINIRKIIYLPIIVVVIVFSFLDMYKNIYKRYVEVIFNCVFATLMGFFAFFIFINIRSWQLTHIKISYIYIYLILLSIVLIERLIIEYLIRKTFKREKLLVIAKEYDVYKIAYNLISNSTNSYELSAIYIVDNGIKNIKQYIIEADKVILGANIEQKYRSDVMKQCQSNHKKILMTPEIYDINIMRPRVTQIDDIPYLYLDNIGLSKVEMDIKRLMDLILSIFFIITLSPLLLVSMLLVKISSKGPIFFLQDRVSKDDKIFKIIKFRTMIKDAEKHTGAILTKENDERVTKIGAFMRSTRLDELPQFINVLKGDMSIVGPRPERPVFVKKFEKEITLYNKRHSVKSGISGLAQIMGKYSTAAEDKLRYDLIYIRNYSVMLDLKILFLTVKTTVLDLGSKSTNNKVDYANFIKKSDIKVIKE